MVSSLRIKVLTGATALLALLLSACGELPVRDGAPAQAFDASAVPDPVPKPEPRSAYGNNPYQVYGVNYTVLPDATDYVERGLASWYGTKFHGKLTSSREPYDMYGMSAAHRSLPLPTYARVTNLQNGRSCVVRVNDRGPFHSDRLIDLSYAAASKLGIVGTGTAMVEVRAIDTRRPADDAQMVVNARPEFGADTPTWEPVGESAPAEIRPRPGQKKREVLYVQVGAFANRDNAERLRDRLVRDINVAAEIQTSVRSEQSLHHVRVGPLKSGWEAERLVTKLKELGVGTPRTVRETHDAGTAGPSL